MANPAALAALQQRFCLIKLEGQICVVDRAQVQQVLSGAGHGGVEFFKKQDGELLMRRHLENQPLPSHDKADIANFWVSPQTHVYEEIAFSPLPTAPTTLNYWTGPTVKPAPGDWRLIRAFLRNVICDGDAEVFNYLIQYLAHMLQKPENKPGIMIVMLGRQGTGKGAFLQLLGRIWGRTTLQVANIDQVLGRFNAALERNYVVCLDEAIFSGDKKAQEQLKSLITEPVCAIEQKYQPARTIRSYHRLFATSNHDHFGNVEHDDRRFVFLRVSDGRQGRPDYFGPLFTEIEDDAAVGAMVHDLMQLDISSFDVRQRPKTKEHLSQKLQSLSGFDRYWYEVLLSGNLSSGGAYLPIQVWATAIFASTRNLMDGFNSFDKNAGRFRPVQSQHIATSLQKLCPSAKHARTKTGTGAQERGYQLPGIDVARREFDAAIGGKVNWNWGGSNVVAIPPHNARHITLAFDDGGNSGFADCQTNQLRPEALAP